ncbi:pilus assembly protein [Sphingomonas sp. PB2P19]|uniref:TadE/TadG family type IV pilus assembly protein n=1 Tax=Sphingomonas rhamnosi TaxID=3096156 RepID=UPI002FC94631
MTVGDIEPGFSDAAPRRAARLARRFAGDRSGLAMLEFALAMPVFIAVSMVGMETVNFAHASQKVGDIATLTADNISRIRIGISEGDVTEALNGIKGVGSSIGFAANGRVIVSSVQPIVNGARVVTDQKIRWQRCTGALAVTSTYGAQSALLGVDGIGPTGRKIAASANDELIFVEVAYTYQPLISNSILGTRTIEAIVGMTVRERSMNDIQGGGTASSCSTYSA